MEKTSKREQIRQLGRIAAKAFLAKFKNATEARDFYHKMAIEEMGNRGYIYTKDTAEFKSAEPKIAKFANKPYKKNGEPTKELVGLYIRFYQMAFRIEMLDQEDSELACQTSK